MEWSAEMAAREMWSGLDLTGSQGQIHAHFKQHLQDAYDAGRYVAYMDAIKMVRKEIKTTGIAQPE